VLRKTEKVLVPNSPSSEAKDRNQRRG